MSFNKGRHFARYLPEWPNCMNMKVQIFEGGSEFHFRGGPQTQHTSETTLAMNLKIN